ncbi:copper chaperone PCu(A)C [Aurantimonas coralicida]|uniref:copper chaperone PCu(A)C n=1 Tax=Aurantimonas coralicida TaxID=182270 RepID=UPI003C6C3621
MSSNPEVSRSTIRRSSPTPPTAKAGYLSICNDGADADRLIGGSATVGGLFEIHESSVENGVARMRRV